jgi:hypothetical protein
MKRVKVLDISHFLPTIVIPAPFLPYPINPNRLSTEEFTSTNIRVNRLITRLEENIGECAGERKVTASWKFAGVRPIGSFPLASILRKMTFTEQSIRLLTIPHISYGRTRNFAINNFLQLVNPLRHYCTSLKVAGSISDEVIKVFIWPNPSCRLMALKSAQPLTEMSKRNLPGDKGRQARKSDDVTAIYEPRF